MSIFDFKNNSLFLACFRERTRPVQIFCFIGLIFSVLILSYFSIAVHEKNTADILKGMFYVIISLQSFILIAEGTLFVWYMGSRERTSDTLDFHRSSPEPVELKIIGLILGSTWLEWIFFAGFFAMELFLALLIDVAVTKVFLFNISLFFSAVFFQSAAAVFSLMTTTKNRKVSILGIFILFWFVSPFFFMMGDTSDMFIHLFGASGFAYIFTDAFPKLTGFFYTVNLPLIVLQMVVQIPLTILFLNGTRRIFCLPNSPTWSKKDVLRFAGFGFFLITGFFVGKLTHLGETGLEVLGRGSYYYHSAYYGGGAAQITNFFTQNISLFMIAFLAMGIILTFFFVPSYFKFSKNVVLKKHGKLLGWGLFEDGFSGYPSVAVYGLLALIFVWFYFLALQIPLAVGAFSFLLLVSYIFSFSGFMEFFRLSKLRKKRMFFATIIILWWAIIPWMFALILDFDWDKAYVINCLSPFAGVWYGIDILIENMFEKTQAVKWWALAAPWVMVGVFTVLSLIERIRVRDLIEEKMTCEAP